MNELQQFPDLWNTILSDAREVALENLIMRTRARSLIFTQLVEIKKVPHYIQTRTSKDHAE